MRKRRCAGGLLGFVASLLVLAVLIAGCGRPSPGGQQGTGTQGGSQPSQSSDRTYRVAMIIAQGGLGDQSYNDLAYAGLQKAARDFQNVEVQTIESPDVVNQGEALLRQAAQSGYDLVLTLEYSHFDPLPRVARDFPDTKFAIVNVEVKEPNVNSILFEEHQGSFLAGALAALVTRDTSIPGINDKKVIGVIGGTKSPGIDKFLVGYEEGAHYIDPEVQVIATYSNNFGDPTLGRELALAQMEQGADIVYHVAGGTGAGVIAAAQERGVYAIGVDSDQDGMAPGHVLTSMLKRVDVAVYDVIKRLAEGTLEAGATLRYGLDVGAVGLSEMKYTRDKIPAEYLAKVEELKQKIISGEIVVTDVTR
ncbi:MAG: BMP family ABC transporter substrate-binding protein [Bacillota bacterium]|nr:MAG: BMP family ABC transporter substrate-binding protein [Bacillota bacterium]